MFRIITFETDRSTQQPKFKWLLQHPHLFTYLSASVHVGWSIHLSYYELDRARRFNDTIVIVFTKYPALFRYVKYTLNYSFRQNS